MQRDRVGKIVAIGNGLCRVIVRSEKLAESLGRIPGVQVHGEDAEHLGWWIIFPEDLRSLIEPAFRKSSKTIVTRHPTQLSLFDSLPSDHTPSASPSSEAQKGKEGRTGSSIESAQRGAKRGTDSPR